MSALLLSSVYGAEGDFPMILSIAPNSVLVGRGGNVRPSFVYAATFGDTYGAPSSKTDSVPPGMESGSSWADSGDDTEGQDGAVGTSSHVRLGRRAQKTLGLNAAWVACKVGAAGKGRGSSRLVMSKVLVSAMRPIECSDGPDGVSALLGETMKTLRARRMVSLPSLWPQEVLEMLKDEVTVIVFPTEMGGHNNIGGSSGGGLIGGREISNTELRCELATLVFRVFGCSMAIFVASAVCVAYAAGLGIVKGDEPRYYLDALPRKHSKKSLPSAVSSCLRTRTFHSLSEETTSGGASEFDLTVMQKEKNAEEIVRTRLFVIEISYTRVTVSWVSEGSVRDLLSTHLPSVLIEGQAQAGSGESMLSTAPLPFLEKIAVSQYADGACDSPERDALIKRTIAQLASPESGLVSYLLARLEVRLAEKDQIDNESDSFSSLDEENHDVAGRASDIENPVLLRFNSIVLLAGEAIEGIPGLTSALENSLVNRAESVKAYSTSVYIDKRSTKRLVVPSLHCSARLPLVESEDEDKEKLFLTDVERTQFNQAEMIYKASFQLAVQSARADFIGASFLSTINEREISKIAVKKEDFFAPTGGPNIVLRRGVI